MTGLQWSEAKTSQRCPNVLVPAEDRRTTHPAKAWTTGPACRLIFTGCLSQKNLGSFGCPHSGPCPLLDMEAGELGWLQRCHQTPSLLFCKWKHFNTIQAIYQWAKGGINLATITNSRGIKCPPSGNWYQIGEDIQKIQKDLVLNPVGPLRVITALL